MNGKYRKKKKKAKRFVLIVLLILIGYELTVNRVHIKYVKNGSVHFKDDGIDVTEKLSEEDLETIKGIFDGKLLYPEHLYWGYSEDSSISLEDGTEKYYISFDTCPVVYDKNRNEYFNISEKENDTIRSLLRKYGCLVKY